ncbi:uncharacterized protein BDR25DRAFT_305016 [Lindgomyces ingoldianus]|uniref:Uncharacterized protein n=1 Tax=Lindgomyces ingoldianus TaxID=673940 RepID=A0ACB6QPZ8_9PLEO|nr:uncharacterized protein BDR25DRAFT_305016 [Lindgomyces ingoldianus]KAF2468638.1 hypothetical protein BDR25DRAFT_305016 [Lindgomyces ingoldianus]
MASTAPQIRSLYRRILRELPTHPSAHQKLSSPSMLQQRIRASFTTPTPKSSPNSKQHIDQFQQAEQFIQYIQAQRMYATLIERYNPGMGMSEEERVRLTARRVGMDLPPEFKAEEK